MSKLSRSLASLVLPVLMASAGLAQSFTNGSGQIPSGTHNSSFSENVDFGDVDLDGDLDAVFADGGDVGNDQNRIWMNLGFLQGGSLGFFEDQTATRLPALQDSSRDVEFADFDSDGDLDLDVANHSSIMSQTSRFWINAGGLQGGTLGFYSDETAARWIGLGGPGSSLPPSQLLGGGGFFDWCGDNDYGDLDNDGDLDLVHSSYGGAFGGLVPTRLFLNDGLGHFSEFNPSGFQQTGVNITIGQPALWAEGTQQQNTLNTTGLNADIASPAADIDLGDIDGDWDLDLLHGSIHQPARMFRNRLAETGGLILRDVSAASFAAAGVMGSGKYEQEFGDFDNDDDIDIYGLNWGSGFNDTTLKNDGLGGYFAPQVVIGSVADEEEVDFGDFDNDGDLDAFVANFSGQDRLYRNDLIPTGTFSYGDATASQLPTSTGIAKDADWTDIDNDGDYDVMVTNSQNQANVLMRNQTEVSDTRAPRPVNLEQLPDRASSAVPSVVRVQVYDNAPYYFTWYDKVVLDFRVDGGLWYTLPMRSSAGQVFRGELPGAMIGAIDYRVRAQDPAGNAATSAIRSFVATDGGCNGAIALYCTSKATSIPGCAPAFAFNGVPSASAKTGFSVSVVSVPGGNAGLFLYTTNGAATVPLQNAFGFLCIQSGPGMFRIGAQSGSGTSGVCDGGYGMNFNQHIFGQTQNPSLVAGASVDMQCWYRDPPNPGGANFSQAARFTVCP